MGKQTVAIFKKVNKRVRDLPIEFLLGRMIIIRTEAERKCEIKKNKLEVLRLCTGVRITPQQVQKSYENGAMVIGVLPAL